MFNTTHHWTLFEKVPSTILTIYFPKTLRNTAIPISLLIFKVGIFHEVSLPKFCINFLSPQPTYTPNPTEPLRWLQVWKSAFGQNVTCWLLKNYDKLVVKNILYNEAK
jgi:hypothetical protein